MGGIGKGLGGSCQRFLDAFGSSGRDFGRLPFTPDTSLSYRLVFSFAPPDTSNRNRGSDGPGVKGPGGAEVRCASVHIHGHGMTESNIHSATPQGSCPAKLSGGYGCRRVGRCIDDPTGLCLLAFNRGEMRRREGGGETLCKRIMVVLLSSMSGSGASAYRVRSTLNVPQVQRCLCYGSL